MSEQDVRIDARQLENVLRSTGLWDKMEKMWFVRDGYIITKDGDKLVVSKAVTRGG